MSDTWAGLLFIGDPHLSTVPHIPACRTPEYTTQALNKLKFSVEYARKHRLLPVLLGDLFHRPRGLRLNLLCRLLDFLTPPVLTIYGNHDCRNAALTDDDPLSVLLSAKCLRRVDECPWRGLISGREVIVGGTSYGKPLPIEDRFNPEECTDHTLVVWITHHNLALPGFERYAGATPVPLAELPGVDIAVNGHYHRRHEEPYPRGRTHWFNPGNLTRVKRDEREHIPHLLRINILPDNWTHTWVPVEHLSFEEVCSDRVSPHPHPMLRNSLFGWRKW